MVTADVRQKLESAGCQMTYSKNHWMDDPQYKGVNSRWETPDGGRFELQFHTPDSFYAKEELTHPSYDRLRSTGYEPSEERLRCRLPARGQWRPAGASPNLRISDTRKGLHEQQDHLLRDRWPREQPLIARSGLLRRLEHDDGPEDEGLRQDLSWRRTSVIVE